MIQTIITHLPFDETISILRRKKESLQDDGTIFLICSTEYDNNGNVVHDFLDIIFEATSLGYTYVNTIVYPTKEVQKVAFCDNVRYVVWLCKNYSLMRIKKDSIREKHIWKDVEWGKRSKNYNPKGKDPGNVWIPTEDDGKATITEHKMLCDQEVINRLLLLADCNDNYKLYNQKFNVSELSLTFDAINNTENNSCEGKVIFKTSENMDEVENGTISTIVTSPPYWDLKDYFKKGQIGQEAYNIYLKRMELVWEECYKKLSIEGSLWININIRIKDGKVISIPYDFIKICKNIGFYYKGIFIWHKSSGIPTSDKNIVDRHEYILLLSKNENFHINSFFDNFKDYKNDDINGGAFWNINRKAGSVGKNFIHPAIYPNELVNRVIKLSTSEGDFVLDPFLGSGTSLIVALQNNRNFIGYEYNEGFKELMESRFKKEVNNLNLVEYL